MTVRFPNSSIIYCISLLLNGRLFLQQCLVLIREPKWSISWSTFCKQKKKKNEHAYAVEPPVTSPLYNGLLCGSGRQPIHWLFYNPLYNGHLKGNGHYYFKRVPNCQTNLSTTASFFSGLWTSQEWSWNLFRKACWWFIVAIVFRLCHLFCCSKHELSTTLIANVVNFVRFVPLTFWLKTLS